MLRTLLEIISVFDFYSPVMETAKDINHAMSDGEHLNNIHLLKYQMSRAEKVLRDNGVDIVSEHGAAFDNEGTLRVKASDYNQAVFALQRNGIQTWQ